MPKFLIHNGTDTVVKLAVEPWADVVILAPEARAEFEYDEPAEVALSLLPESEAAVSVMSDRLKYSASGRVEEWKDTTGFLTGHLKNKE